jgi:hypothetical protein
MSDTFRFALAFGLLFVLIMVIYQAGCTHGRWLERRRQSRQQRLARHDQERWGITTIHSFGGKPGPK